MMEMFDIIDSTVALRPLGGKPGGIRGLQREVAHHQARGYGRSGEDDEDVMSAAGISSSYSYVIVAPRWGGGYYGV